MLMCAYLGHWGQWGGRKWFRREQRDPLSTSSKSLGARKGSECLLREPSSRPGEHALSLLSPAFLTECAVSGQEPESTRPRTLQHLFSDRPAKQHHTRWYRGGLRVSWKARWQYEEGEKDQDQHSGVRKWPALHTLPGGRKWRATEHSTRNLLELALTPWAPRAFLRERLTWNGIWLDVLLQPVSNFFLKYPWR